MFPSALRREILIVLAVKAALLTLIYFLFFSPVTRIAVSPAAIRTHLLDSRS